MHAVAESGPRQGTTTALCFVFVSGGENTKRLYLEFLCNTSSGTHRPSRSCKLLRVGVCTHTDVPQTWQQCMHDHDSFTPVAHDTRSPDTRPPHVIKHVI
jgi:hypothetical protein